jgi:hypothetical protein
MNSILYQVILNRFGQQEPGLQHFRYLISGKAYAPGRWYSLTEVIHAMASHGLCTPGPELAAACKAWLSGLAGLGWCGLGSTAHGDTCFRWMRTKPQLPSSGLPGDAAGLDGQSRKEPDDNLEDTKFIVQPDFEILVPPETPYVIRWRLAGCTELHHTDDLWSFRLTREAFVAAAEQGESPGSILSWLAAHSQGGLPGQVEQALKHWANGIGRTELSEVILLTCRNEPDGEAIAAHPRLQDSLTRVGPLHFIVLPGELAQVRKELAGAGMAPPRFIGGRQEEPPAPGYVLSEGSQAPDAGYCLPDQEQMQGIMDSRPALQLLPFEPAEAEDIMLAARAGVPQMWIKEWRQYHSTTAQKVMEQALDWGVKVRLSLEDAVYDFIPGRISVNPWKVTGYLLGSDGAEGQEIELAAGDWREIKLLLPREVRNSSSSGAGGYVMIR